MTDASAGGEPGARTPADQEAGQDDIVGEDGQDHEDDEIDEASAESFPASDAPEGWSGPPGT